MSVGEFASRTYSVVHVYVTPLFLPLASASSKSAQGIHIPVPPRKRSISLEAALEKDRMASLADEKDIMALSRAGSLASQRSMFDD